MDFIDLKEQYRRIQKDVEQRMQAVFQHGQFILGPEVYTLEEKLANYLGVKHCIGVANGTDAILMAMMALGIKPGDEVITTPFSFVATVEMSLLLGAKPVFVDIDPQTYNLDPGLLKAAITRKTKVIMPVNLYGQSADYDSIMAIANCHDLSVIEDAAQSLGATYKGRPSGSFGTISCTSFFPSKPLGCYSDGGACFTNDENLAEQLRQIRNHGQESRYHHVRLGLNSRLATLQATVLLAKLDIFERELKLRAKAALKYNTLLSEHVVIPFIEPHNFSNYAQYTIQTENRDYVREYLQKQGIPTTVHYPTPLHKQPILAHATMPKKGFPIAERVANKVLSLPFHPYLKDADIEQVARSIRLALA